MNFSVHIHTHNKQQYVDADNRCYIHYKKIGRFGKLLRSHIPKFMPKICSGLFLVVGKIENLHHPDSGTDIMTQKIWLIMTKYKIHEPDLVLNSIPGTSGSYMWRKACLEFG